ncbi:13640_t:CDS:1, partial [Dentiscutata erythropus]
IFYNNSFSGVPNGKDNLNSNFYEVYADYLTEFVCWYNEQELFSKP